MSTVTIRSRKYMRNALLRRRQMVYLFFIANIPLLGFYIIYFILGS